MGEIILALVIIYIQDKCINKYFLLHDVRLWLLHRNLDVFDDLYGDRVRYCDVNLVRLRYRDLDLLRYRDWDRVWNRYRVFLVDRYLHRLRRLVVSSATTAVLLRVGDPHRGQYKHLRNTSESLKVIIQTRTRASCQCDCDLNRISPRDSIQNTLLK